METPSITEIKAAIFDTMKLAEICEVKRQQLLQLLAKAEEKARSFEKEIPFLKSIADQKEWDRQDDVDVLSKEQK